MTKASPEGSVSLSSGLFFCLYVANFLTNWRLFFKIHLDEFLPIGQWARSSFFRIITDFRHCLRQSVFFYLVMHLIQFIKHM